MADLLDSRFESCYRRTACTHLSIDFLAQMTLQLIKRFRRCNPVMLHSPPPGCDSAFEIRHIVLSKDPSRRNGPLAIVHVAFCEPFCRLPLRSSISACGP